MQRSSLNAFSLESHAPPFAVSRRSFISRQSIESDKVTGSIRIKVDTNGFEGVTFYNCALMGISNNERRPDMEKSIVRWSYWLGVACVALSILMRALNLVGLAGINSPLGGNPVGYSSFFRAA